MKAQQVEDHVITQSYLRNLSHEKKIELLDATLIKYFKQRRRESFEDILHIVEQRDNKTRSKVIYQTKDA